MPLDEETIRLIEQLMEVAQDASTLPAYCQGALLASGITHVQVTWRAYIATHGRQCITCGEPSGLRVTCPDCAVEAFLSGRDLTTTEDGGAHDTP